MNRSLTKLDEIDLRELAGMTSSDRAFLSLYYNGKDGWEQERKQLEKNLALLKDQPEESEHLQRNLELLEKELKGMPNRYGQVAAFVCWLLDFCEVYTLPVPVPNLARIDSSPFIRPLAELQDEYENYAVVIADNTSAKVYLVSSNVTEDKVAIKGNIKNSVKVGGWSQQRYKRRRDKQLHHYAKDIAGELLELDKENAFRRVLMVGSKETLRAIKNALPTQVANKAVVDKALDLGKPDDVIESELYELFAQQEVESEQILWETIRNEYLKGGLAIMGMEDTLRSAQRGQVEKVLVERSYKPNGVRCRSCEHLQLEAAPCEECSSEDCFEVGLINELVELLARSSAEIDFCSPIPGLKEAGSIAALLRYPLQNHQSSGGD